MLHSDMGEKGVDWARSVVGLETFPGLYWQSERPSFYI